MGRGRVLGAIVSVLLGAGLITVGSAAAQPTESRPTAGASVINGNPVTIASFPWMAVAVHQSSQCTATVVAPRLILTAGHCVENLEAGGLRDADQFRVITGLADVRQAGRANISRVSRVLVFPGFTPDALHGDAGLLVLAEPVTAVPLALAGPADAALYRGGTRVAIAGWGLTDPDSWFPSPVLRAGEAIVQSEERCARRGSEVGADFSSDSDLCVLSTRDNATSGCNGDSGGPAIAHRADGSPVQVGIISFGHWRCAVRYPQFLTRVDHVSGWVTEWIAAVESGGPEPAVKTPEVRVPRMRKADAKQYAGDALLESFRSRFLRGKDRHARCRRVDRESVKCRVTWDLGRFDYFGAVTVFYKLGPEGVTWDYRFRIHRVNERCRARQAHCPVHTRVR